MERLQHQTSSKEMRGSAKEEARTALVREWIAYERALYEKDEKMLKRLIELRGYMWT